MAVDKRISVMLNGFHFLYDTEKKLIYTDEEDIEGLDIKFCTKDERRQLDYFLRYRIKEYGSNNRQRQSKP